MGHATRCQQGVDKRIPTEVGRVQLGTERLHDFLVGQIRIVYASDLCPSAL